MTSEDIQKPLSELEMIAMLTDCVGILLKKNERLVKRIEQLETQYKMLNLKYEQTLCFIEHTVMPSIKQLEDDGK